MCILYEYFSLLAHFILFHKDTSVHWQQLCFSDADVHRTPLGNLLKMQILISVDLGSRWDSAFLTSSLLMLLTILRVVGVWKRPVITTFSLLIYHLLELIWCDCLIKSPLIWLHLQVRLCSKSSLKILKSYKIFHLEKKFINSKWNEM